MEKTSITSQAEQTYLSPEAQKLRAHIRTLEGVKQSIDKRLAVAKNLLAPYAMQEQEADTRERILHPKSIEDMLLDPSYNDDKKYNSPSDTLDDVRSESYTNRQAALWKTREQPLPPTFEADMTIMQNILSRNPASIADIQRQSDEWQETNSRKGMWGRLMSWLDGEKKTLDTKLNGLKHQLQLATERLPAYEQRMENERARRTERELIPQNKGYDQQLHAYEAEGLSLRNNQSVLVSFQKQKYHTDVFTLHLPQSPDDADFSTTVTLRFDDWDDTTAFVALLGKDSQTYDSIFPTVAENVDSEYQFDDELIHFALETVQTENGLRFRLPQVVWERFGASIA